MAICNYMKHGSDSVGMVNPNSAPHIAAFDPLTGTKQWSFPTQYFNQSSLLSTAADLIFAGDLEGHIFALDAWTGKKLWSFSTGGRIAAPPVTFSVHGRRYLAVSPGGGSCARKFCPHLMAGRPRKTPPSRLPRCSFSHYLRRNRFCVEWA